MGDHWKMGEPSRYVTNHPGELSLAIPLWVGAMSTSENWDVNRYTAQCTSPVSVVWQCKLVSGWGLMKRRSVPSYGPYGSGRTLFIQLSVWWWSSALWCDVVGGWSVVGVSLPQPEEPFGRSAPVLVTTSSASLKPGPHLLRLVVDLSYNKLCHKSTTSLQRIHNRRVPEQIFFVSNPSRFNDFVPTLTPIWNLNLISVFPIEQFPISSHSCSYSATQPMHGHLWRFFSVCGSLCWPPTSSVRLQAN